MFLDNTGYAWMVEMDAKATRKRAARRECCMTLEGLLICSGRFAAAALVLLAQFIARSDCCRSRKRVFILAQEGCATIYGAIDGSPLSFSQSQQSTSILGGIHGHRIISLG